MNENNLCINKSISKPHSYSNRNLSMSCLLDWMKTDIIAIKDIIQHDLDTLSIAHRNKCLTTLLWGEI